MSPRPTPAGMHPADIGAALKKRGTNLTRLALENGFGESTLRAALKKPHPRAQKLIAEAIGVPVHRIWPQWFDASGDRIGAGSRSRSPHRSQAQQAGVSAAFHAKDAA